MHSLTVGHNKLGDLEYAQGNLPAAQAGYRHALVMRQRAFDERKASGETARCARGPWAAAERKR